MPESTESRAGRPAPTSDTFRWVWVALSVLAGAMLVVLFLAVVDPGLDQPKISAAIVAATLILMGMLVGYRSPGFTVWEPGVGGFVLIAISALALLGSGTPTPSALVILGALAVGPVLAVAGAWAGEMLQGTYEDDLVGVQWLWVVVGVVVGFMTGVYSLYLASALFDAGFLGLLGSFGASFMVTGFIVGFFSPGTTIVEPAIATVALIVMDSALALVQFHALFPLGAVMLALLLGVVLSVTGAWIGEAAQDIKTGQQAKTGSDRGGM